MESHDLYEDIDFYNINAIDYLDNPKSENQMKNNHLFTNANNYGYSSVICPCEICMKNYIQCEMCEGFFKLEDYFSNHKALCFKMHAIYEEKMELTECNECGTKVKFSLYDQHKEKCSYTSIKNVKIPCSICSVEFSVDLLNEHELNCEKTQSEILLINEKVNCSVCNEAFSMIQIEGHEKNCLKIKNNDEEMERKLQEGGIKLPRLWINVNNYDGAEPIHQLKDKIYLVPVDQRTEEFSEIDMLFQSTFIGDFSHKIVNIFRIQNEPLYEKHYRELLRMQEEKRFPVVEKLLFYANNSITPDNICINGIDISFALDNAKYGRCLEFYRRADKVMNLAYKKNKKDPTCFIFLTNVLVGVPYTAGLINQNWRKPPFYDESKYIYYDSVTNMDNLVDKKDEDQVYAVYNNEKAYPSYVLEINHIHKIY